MLFGLGASLAAWPGVQTTSDVLAILLFSLAYVLINLAVDMTYTFFDPRIRY